MIQVVNGVVETRLRAIEQLLEPGKYSMPRRGAIRLRTLADGLGAANQRIEAERQKLFDEFGQRDDTGKLKTKPVEGFPGRFQIDIAPEHKADFDAQMSALLSDTAEVLGHPLEEEDLPPNIDVPLIFMLGEIVVDKDAETSPPKPVETAAHDTPPTA